MTLSKILLLALFAFAIVTLPSCRTSLNADELVANTLSGRAGEIRAALDPGLPIAERTELARYLAKIEPLTAQAARLSAEADRLQSSSRETNVVLSDRYSKLADAVHELGVALEGLRPPASLAAAHDGIIAAYLQQGTVAAELAKAFAKLDFATLRKLSSDQAAANSAVAAAHERMAKAATALLQTGKTFRVPPQATNPS